MTKQVIRNEGFRGFWMGSGLGLVQSMPSTVIYMTSYENIKCNLTKLADDRGCHGNMLTGAIPGFSGAVARSLVVTILAPLELVRTRTLAGLGSGSSSVPPSTTGSTQSPSSQGVWSLIRTIHRTEGGVSAFYRGLGSTIMRDTPFSAIYWMSFEAVKNNIYSHLLVHDGNRESTSAEHATVNFLSGSTSGTLAAIITHPFDVLKTQSQLAVAAVPSGSSAPLSSNAPPLSSHTACARQVCCIMAECCCPCTSSVTAAAAAATTNTNTTNTTIASPTATATTRTSPVSAPLSMRRGLAQIIRSRGLAGLFSGLSMRLATIIPGSGIMITVYEFAKTFDLKK